MTDEEQFDLYAGFINEWLDYGNQFFKAQTSGSTGVPKKIQLSRKIMTESAQRTISFFGIDRSWLLLSCISAKYIGGKMMAVRALISQASLRCIQPSNHPSIEDAVRWKGNILIAVVPSQMWHILSIPFTESEKKRIHFLIGGAAIPPELRRQIVESGVQAWETYGMTETASHIALRKVTQRDEYFQALPGITLSKCDNDTLAISLQDNVRLVTNDLVEFNGDGRFRILGRADNVIITGGLKVIPELLEHKISRILAQDSIMAATISEVMVTSRPDSLWGEALTLLVEIHSAEENNQEEICGKIYWLLRKHFKTPESTLQSHEIPKHIEIISALPRTANGKLQRRHTY
ncbi:MAG: AMP-binding protein [Muribaculaceae bacterium]|nr:AMP-binding protein [Muribaculaceae bacterium]